MIDRRHEDRPYPPGCRAEQTRRRLHWNGLETNSQPERAGNFGTEKARERFRHHLHGYRKTDPLAFAIDGHTQADQFTRKLISGPPLLPGLIAASVCSNPARRVAHLPMVADGFSN